MNQCTTCKGSTEGYKCDMCGAVSDEKDENHSCGGGRCMPKCLGCNEAETGCRCVVKSETTA
jgi:hypothetical protein